MLRSLRLVVPTTGGARLASTLPQCEHILVKDHSEGVFNVQLNRPEQRNAFTLQVWKELHAVFDHLAVHPKCRAIVLSGNGKSFCAGIDLKESFTTMISVINDDKLDVARKSRKLREVIKACQDSYTSLEKCPKPVVAAIHSHCVGAGINMVSCADVRYAVNDATFSIKEVDIGLAADVGILQRIHRITGNDSWSREIAFTARNFSAAEALKYGFVSRTFDSQEACLDAALSLAAEIASKSPVAVQGTKLAMNYARSHSVDDSLEWMLNWNQSQLQTEDLVRNAMARGSKQKPEFEHV
ncbi:enoyl-CoA hydratase/isomerase [Aphelenchoides avenae]|nr:enoyl-CoA hydratase/isomerase [Aphelenchus avenae]